MTTQEFIDKWNSSQEKEYGWWGMTVDRIFWAKSYQMPKKHLLEMSQDYLSIITQLDGGSSENLARKTVGGEMMGKL